MDTEIVDDFEFKLLDQALSQASSQQKNSPSTPTNRFSQYARPNTNAKLNTTNSFNQNFSANTNKQTNQYSTNSTFLNNATTNRVQTNSQSQPINSQFMQSKPQTSPTVKTPTSNTANQPFARMSDPTNNFRNLQNTNNMNSNKVELNSTSNQMNFSQPSNIPKQNFPPSNSPSRNQPNQNFNSGNNNGTPNQSQNSISPFQSKVQNMNINSPSSSPKPVTSSYFPVKNTTNQSQNMNSIKSSAPPNIFPNKNNSPPSSQITKSESFKNTFTNSQVNSKFTTIVNNTEYIAANKAPLNTPSPPKVPTFQVKSAPSSTISSQGKSPKEAPVSSQPNSQNTAPNLSQAQKSKPANSQQLLFQQLQQRGGEQFPLINPAPNAPPCPRSQIPSEVSIVFINEDTIAIADPPDQELKRIFYAVPGVQLDTARKQFLFPKIHYDSIVSNLSNLGRIDLKLPPPIALEVLCRPQPPLPTPQLDKIQTVILDKLMPFQLQGVMYLGCLFQSNEQLCNSKEREEWPLLILVPASVKFQWASEIEKFMPDLKSEQLNVISSGKEDCDKLVNIVSYDTVKRKDMQEKILARKFKVIICDESHMMRSHKSERTKKVAPIVQSASRAIFLSGTPALSRPAELFPQLEMLDSRLFPGNIWSSGFASRYCGAFFDRYRWRCDGSSNLSELHLILERTIMIRRLKKDVLQELPNKKRRVVKIEVSKEHYSLIRRISQDWKNAKKEIYSNVDKEKSNQSRSKSKGLVMELWKDLGTAKVLSVNEYINSFLESDVKFIVFAHHIEVLDGVEHNLVKRKVGHIRIDGSVPPNLRGDRVELFQNDPEIRVAILSITACGTGLNLTAAKAVVFAELFWNPGSLKQAEDRVHRIGQQDDVDIRYLIAGGTVDEIMWSILEKKLEILGEALNGQAEIIDTDTSEHKVDFDKIETDEFMEQMFQRFESYVERNKFMDERIKRKRERKKQMQNEEPNGKDEISSSNLLNDEKMDDDDFDTQEKAKRNKKRNTDSTKIFVEDKNFDTINDTSDDDESPLMLGATVPVSIVSTQTPKVKLDDEDETKLRLNKFRRRTE